MFVPLVNEYGIIALKGMFLKNEKQCQFPVGIRGIRILLRGSISRMRAQRAIVPINDFYLEKSVFSSIKKWLEHHFRFPADHHVANRMKNLANQPGGSYSISICSTFAAK